jgi:predicted glycoside hydrolase/deacetylase ChbG (UPF0249 family)
MKKLIINADDFGYRTEINRGIIYAYQNGVVTSTSLFVEREGTDDALRLARENPALGFGLHLDLDRFFEVDHGFGVIVDWATPRPAPDEIRTEIKRQIEKYFSFGLSMDHMDSHHHAHLHPAVFPLVCSLVKEFKIPAIRFFRKFYGEEAEYDRMKEVVNASGLQTVDHFIEGWYWGNVDEPYQVAELMTHPGYGELWREAELAHCCQPQLKQYFFDQKIDIIRFSEIFSSR